MLYNRREMADPELIEEPDPEAPPPFGGTWNRLYAIVLGELALLVILFYIFTKAFE